MRHIAALMALFCASCASMPAMSVEGLPLAKTGWRMQGGADFEKQAWFVLFWRPWGQAESDAAAAADKIILP